MRRWVASITLVLLGCAGDGPTEPSMTDVHGYWHGETVDAYADLTLSGADAHNSVRAIAVFHIGSYRLTNSVRGVYTGDGKVITPPYRLSVTVPAGTDPQIDFVCTLTDARHCVGTISADGHGSFPLTVTR